MPPQRDLLTGTLACALALTCTAAPAAPPGADDADAPPHFTRAEWVRRFGERIPGRRVGGGGPVKVVVTTVEDDGPGHVNGFTHGGVRVSEDGVLAHFHHDALGSGGTGYPKIPVEDLDRLKLLLSKLPDDGGDLPPAGRRVLIQVAEGDRFRTRVYNRGLLPDAILEVLRLTRSGVRPWLPEFEPTRSWRAYERTGHGDLILAPAGRNVIAAPWQAPLTVWDPHTGERVREIARPSFTTPVRRIVLGPDGTRAAIDGGGTVTVVETDGWTILETLEEPFADRLRPTLSAPRFTADGRFLLLERHRRWDGGLDELLAYDTADWSQVLLPAHLPDDPLSWFPAPDGGRGLYRPRGGPLSLWDAAGRRDVAELDEHPETRARRVAFSPDSGRVAAATWRWDAGAKRHEHRLRVWDAATGRLVHELRPFEQDLVEPVEALLWSPDGRFVLAAVKPHGFWSDRGVAVWSIASGRHRGQFVRFGGGVTGLVMPDTDTLVAGCEDGTVRVWDAAAAFGTVTAFEAAVAAESDTNTNTNAEAGGADGSAGAGGR